MNWSDHNNQKLSGVSEPKIITEVLNESLQAQGIMGSKYYLYSAGTDKLIISTVPSTIYDKLKPIKYIAPKRVDNILKSKILNLQENFNILHNNHPDAAPKFANGKVFQLNQCHYNSTGVFHLVRRLVDIKAIRVSKPTHIVLGYIARRIPFGTQVGSYVIENNSVWLHDWHVWNYIENILVDMSMFINGSLLPPDSNIASWGESQDHVFIYPPKGLEYWGIAYSNYNKFTKDFSQFITK